MIPKPQDDGINTKTQIKCKETHHNSSRLDLMTTVIIFAFDASSLFNLRIWSGGLRLPSEFAN